MDRSNTTQTINNNYEVILKTGRFELPDVHKPIKRNLSYCQAKRLAKKMKHHELTAVIIENKHIWFLF